MLARHAGYVRRLRARRRITLPLSLLTVTATGVAALAAVTTELDWTWWTPVGALLLLLLFGTFSSVQRDDGREREVPDTPLEAACVVGLDIVSWGEGCASGMHDVRVIARPLGDATGPLVHGLQQFPTESACPIEPGMLFGFRRYPGLKHLVRIEPQHDPSTLMTLRTEAERALGDPQPEDARPEDARPEDARSSGTGSVPRTPAPPASQPEAAEVASVAVGAHRHGDFWETVVTVHTEDGTELTETRYRLPEELAQFEAGRGVSVVRDQNAASATPRPTCVIVPSTL
ncbi:hypothetical protein DSC45_33150 [Streptomyces sp. YIM 130001]|nr:hypothetical protein DSC45_33150 [Streptomyces sp. YIM 130001]